MLTIHDLSKDLQLSPKTLKRRISEGLIPAGIRIGGSVRWNEATIAEWKAAGCPKQSTKHGNRLQADGQKASP